LQLPKGTATEYADVPADAWHYNTIMAAKAAGLLDGLLIEGNNFEPEKPVTREEMAVIMANAAKYSGRQFPVSAGKFDEEYIDATEITEEYRQYV